MTQQRTFIDVFGGCGGLSLGLMQAGWKGLFAIEADTFAFDSLKSNLLAKGGRYRYSWPKWLDREPCEVTKFIETHRDQLKKLAGKVYLITGGPPCQGFSLAGRRKKNDPRNGLFRHYLEIVKIVRPPLLFFENVRGVAVEFGKKHQKKRKRGPGRPRVAFSVKIQQELDALGYKVFPKLVRAADFGVPQLRPRYIMIAIDKVALCGDEEFTPFTWLEEIRKQFLAEKGLPPRRPVWVREAISDLKLRGKKLVPCEDTDGYEQIEYKGPLTHYQSLLHGDMNGTAPNSMRIIKHGDVVRERFAKILETARRGVQLSPAVRKKLGINKMCVVPLNPEKPSHTLTSLPDDLIHYSEPRVLTAREYARLQSFPDWFEFKGKYSTGGNRRVRECPRYTQIANAVPPFLAEVIGLLLARVAEEIENKQKQSNGATKSRSMPEAGRT
ncbi:MAG: DNA cytosine methyltransferase [Planctomycetes bacterium]|nr:DNA cytosine methyltransferase [Planctomycetota bacterium]